MVELANSGANQRIYVYVGGAAQSFRDQTRSFVSKIEFWDEAALESALNETGLTPALYFDNSLANAAIWAITRTVWTTVFAKSTKPIPPKMSKRLLQNLWGMKDRVVTVHKTAFLAMSYLESVQLHEEKDGKAFDGFASWALNYVFEEGLLSLARVFDNLPQEMTNLLRWTYSRTKVRSNWSALAVIRPGLLPGNVIDVCKSDAREPDALNKRIDKRKMPARYRRAHLTDLIQFFRYLYAWSWAVEETLDNMYEECVNHRAG